MDFGPTLGIACQLGDNHINNTEPIPVFNAVQIDPIRKQSCHNLAMLKVVVAIGFVALTESVESSFHAINRVLRLP